MQELSVAVNTPERTPPKMIAISSNPGKAAKKKTIILPKPGKGSAG